MCPHPEQMMALATINMHEIAEETARRRLVTEAMKAQQGASKGQPRRLTVLHAIASQFPYRLSLPMWEAVLKHS